MEYQKITKVSKNSQKNNSETVSNENDKEMPKEIPKERYMSPEERQKITDNLCDYSYACILVKGTISIAPQARGNSNNANKKVVFKNCAPFTDCISEINNTQIDNVKHIYVIIPMYNLIEYSDNYSKTSGILWQYYRDEPALTDADAIANFHAADSSASFKFKQKITGVKDEGAKNVEIIVSLKYLRHFWRTYDMPWN